MERAKGGKVGGATAGAGGDEVLDPRRLHTADAGGGSLGRVGFRPSTLSREQTGERENSGGP